MSLLSNLSLDYEILADDPIEMGIRYGKSVLSSLSNSVTNAEQLINQRQPQYAYAPVTRATIPRPILSRENALSERTQNFASRRNFIDYSTRPSAMGYSRRNMVGAL